MALETMLVECPARYLAGLRLRMNIAEASEKCPALWETFMARHKELTDIVEDDAYGVSSNMQENGELDYWAMLAVSPTAAIPRGMESLTLRAGKYVRCVVALASIKEGYEFLYGEWARAHTPVDFTSACFERYSRDWQKTGHIELFVPLSCNG